MKVLLCFLTFSNSEASSLFSSREYCISKGVDYRVVETIAEIESVKRNGYLLGYPFIIRVNNKRIRVRGLRRLSLYGNVYDCESKKLCIYVAKKLIEKGIRNIDMGVFQINYLYNRWRRNIISRAFDTYDAYRVACDIVAENIEKYGYTPTAVAYYHSRTPLYNRRYARKFVKIYKRKLKQTETNRKISRTNSVFDAYR